MESPAIRYAATDDGASLAYWTRGAGPDLLYVNIPLWSHAELVCGLEPLHRFLERIGRGRRLIYFDPRGF